MPIASTDLVAYGSATMPDSDATTNIGGAISTTKRVVFTDISPTGTVEAASDNAGDTTQTITFYGRTADGTLTSEAETLNGTSYVATATSFERILKITLSGATTGDVTVRESGPGDTLVTMEAGLLEVRRPFYDAAADVSGGSARDYYEKIFLKNNHGTLALTSATVAEQADPSGNVTFALESSLDGTDTNGAGNDRQTVGDLSGYTFDGTTKNVANSQSLTAGSAQGVWLKLSLAAGAAASNTSYTLRLSGNSA